MPEHIRALIVVIVVAVLVFAVAGKQARHAIAGADLARRRNLWLALTLVAFLAHSFWLYLVLAGAMLVIAQGREKNAVALFLFLLSAVPAMRAEIPGIGPINKFFTIDHLRLLELAVLLPAFLALWQRPATLRFGQNMADKLVGAYIVLFAILQVTATTFTDALRETFYLFIDIFLPYYVFSRALTNVREFRDALASFVVPALVLAAIGIFEFAKGWLLYASLNDALDVHWGFGNYLRRDGNLRALASAGQPIALGYLLTVALGLVLFLRDPSPHHRPPLSWIALLMLGLVATVSRGPWVGAVVLYVMFIATGGRPAVRLVALAVAAASVAAVLAATPFGERVVQYLPFIGTIEQGNVTYRQLLIERTTKVLLQSPLFGVPNALGTSELQSLRQGQGIIDVVNTYLGIALVSGLVGLSLFVSIFATVGANVYVAMRRSGPRDDDFRLLGRVLFSTLVSVLVMIGTVSSITVIPVVYWSLAGLGVGYAQLARHKAAQPARVDGSRMSTAG